MTSSEIPRILDQLHRTFEGAAWHGDSVMKVLEGVTAEQAAQRPLENAHSIWELVLHMTTWKNVARWRIEHHDHVPTEEENFPAVTDTSDDAWRLALERLVDAHLKLYDAVLRMTEEQLDEEFPPNGQLSHYVRLHGVIQHDLYHAGQIALLKKG